MNRLLVLAAFLVGCTPAAPAPPAPSSSSPAPVATSPDDQGPQERLLARETTAHRDAPAAPSAVSPPSTPPASDEPLPAPVARPWQDAGVLVFVLGNEDATKTHAASLRWHFSHEGAGAWSHTADAVHVYEKLWAVRVSPVNLDEARRLCSWLDRPTKGGKTSWLAADEKRTCRFSLRPTLTSKTEYVALR